MAVVIVYPVIIREFGSRHVCEQPTATSQQILEYPVLALYCRV